MPTDLPVGFPQPTTIGVIEIKSYPDYRGVTYTHGGDLARATGVAFNSLFQHIQSNNISMTTPVEARYFNEETNQSAYAEVSFLYARPEINPDQVQPNVAVTDTPSMTVVSIGIQGAYTWDSYKVHLEKLEDWLATHPEYQVVGPPRRLFYHSPMTPEAMKYSEVQIPVSLQSHQVA
ncbi:MAG: heme-binding protein [Microcoleaceae cyanobacterium]